ncbi:hypothetical protein H5410_015064, partial [Solanum commersonii]
MNFDVLPKKLCEPFCVSTHVWIGFMHDMPPLIVELELLGSKFLMSHVETYDIQSIPIVKEFLEVFLNDLRRVPPKRETDLGIDIFPDTHSISILPYRMAPTKLKKLKEQLEDLFDK